MNKLNAKECADSIIEGCRLKGADLPFRPCLGIIMVEGNEASERYVRNKIKDAERCGFNTRLARLPNTSSQDTVIDAIEEMVDCGEVHGLIVQLPLPKGINEEEVLEHIPAVMDVDGLTKENMAELYSGSGKGFAPVLLKVVSDSSTIMTCLLKEKQLWSSGALTWWANLCH